MTFFIHNVWRSLLCSLDCHVSGGSFEEFGIEGRSTRLHLYKNKTTGEWYTKPSRYKVGLPLEWYGLGSVIQDHLDHCALKELENPPRTRTGGSRIADSDPDYLKRTHPLLKAKQAHRAIFPFYKERWLRDIQKIYVRCSSAARAFYFKNNTSWKKTCITLKLMLCGLNMEWLMNVKFSFKLYDFVYLVSWRGLTVGVCRLTFPVVWLLKDFQKCLSCIWRGLFTPKLEAKSLQRS